VTVLKIEKISKRVVLIPNAGQPMLPLALVALMIAWSSLKYCLICCLNMNVTDMKWHQMASLKHHSSRMFTLLR